MAQSYAVKRRRLNGDLGGAPPPAANQFERDLRGYSLFLGEDIDDSGLFQGASGEVEGLRTTDYHYDLYKVGDFYIGELDRDFRSVLRRCLHHGENRGQWPHATELQLTFHVRVSHASGAESTLQRTMPSVRADRLDVNGAVAWLEAELDSEMVAVVEFLTVGFSLPPGGGVFVPLTHDNILNGRKRGIKRIYTKRGKANCAGKALAYLYALKYKRRVQPDALGAYIPMRNSSNYGRKNARTLESDADWLTVKAGLATDREVGYDELVKFVECGALGARVRIAVFELTQQRRLSFITPHPDGEVEVEESKGSEFPDPSPSFRAADPDTTVTFYLFWTQHGLTGHFDAVLKPNCVWNTPKFCEQCNKGYQSDATHWCMGKCSSCMHKNCDGYISSVTPNPELQRDWVVCDSCNRVFYGATSSLEDNVCYQNHKKPNKKGVSTCSRIWQCAHPDCVNPDPSRSKKSPVNLLYSRVTQEEHVHGEVHWCLRCEEMTALDHPCHLVAPSDNYMNRYRKVVWYFDFETQSKVWTDRDDKLRNLHTVDFVDAQRSDHDDSQGFGSAETHKQFLNIDAFMEWVMEGFFEKGYSGKVFIAHNGRGYDFQFVRRWLLQHKNHYEPKVIKSGSKYMKLTICKLGQVRSCPTKEIVFLDSLNFIPSSLKAFTKTFGLGPAKKGHFPHWFSRVDNVGYAGIVPHWSCFRPRNLSEKDAKEFVEWYHCEMVRTTPPAELDTSALRAEFGASLYNTPDTLPPLPPHTSYVGPWDLDANLRSYCEDDVKVLRLGFETLRNDLRNLMPDHEEAKGVDPCCYTTINALCQQIFLYYFYAAMDIAVLDNEVDSFIRRAMRGGRVEPFCLTYEINLEEEPETKIEYVDFTSLYPAVNKMEKYPVSHPTIFTELKTEQDWENLRASHPDLEECHDEASLLAKISTSGWGVVACDFEGPEGLYTPVLPFKTKGLPVSYDLLEHKDQVICTRELGNALTAGYRVDNLQQLCWWSEDSTTVGMFGRYVDTFYKIKIEAKGWPAGCVTEADKDAYMVEIKERDSLDLTRDNIGQNKGKYFIAKRMLNCLWGRFGMRKNQTQHKTFYADQLGEFWTLLTDAKYECSREILIDGVSAEVTYKLLEEHVSPAHNTNIAVAVATTAAGRSWLYEKLLRVYGRRVLYMDTDSCVLLTRAGEESPELGNALGDLTDELEGDRAVGFQSGGPKNYALKLVRPDGSVHCKTKVKSFNLNYGHLDPRSAANLIDYEKIKRVQYEAFIEGEGKTEETVVISGNQIVRDRSANLWDEQRGKTYRANFSKREVVVGTENGNHTLWTYPHGFQKEAPITFEVDIDFD